MQALELLNHGENLLLLTMLPWKDLLDSRGKGLFAKEKRWCPQCYYDSAQQESGLFEPLCWSIGIMDSCHVHECKLITNCRSCGAPQPMISRQVSMGYCFECGAFLGCAKKMLPRKLTLKEKYLLNLLGCAEHACKEEDLNTNLVRGIKRVMSDLGVTSYKKLESEIGFTHSTIGQWCADKESARKTRPTLSSLINFCLAVSVPPRTLLFEQENIMAEASTVNISSRHQFANSSKKEWVREQLKLMLKNQKSALPLKGLADKLQVGVGYLRYHFPAEVDKFLSRNRCFRSEAQAQKRVYKEKLVREAIIEISGRQLYPSHGRVKEHIGEDFKKFQFKDFAEIWSEEIDKLLNS